MSLIRLLVQRHLAMPVPVNVPSAVPDDWPHPGAGRGFASVRMHGLQHFDPAFLQGVQCDDYRWGARERIEESCGHGRIERRSIQVSEDLADCPEWLDFPDVRRVFRIRREVSYKKDGRQRQPVRGVCWSWCKAIGEDACRVRKGSLPRVPPAECEQRYHQTHETLAMVAGVE